MATECFVRPVLSGYIEGAAESLRQRCVPLQPILMVYGELVQAYFHDGLAAVFKFENARLKFQGWGCSNLCFVAFVMASFVVSSPEVRFPMGTATSERERQPPPRRIPHPLLICTDLYLYGHSSKDKTRNCRIIRWKHYTCWKMSMGAVPHQGGRRSKRPLAISRVSTNAVDNVSGLPKLLIVPLS